MEIAVRTLSLGFNPQASKRIGQGRSLMLLRISGTGYIIETSEEPYLAVVLKSSGKEANLDQTSAFPRLQQQQKVDGFVQNQLVKTACSSLQQRYCTIETCRRQQPPEIDKLSMLCSGLCDIISFGEEDVGVSSLQFEEFSVATATIVLMIKNFIYQIDVVVNGAKTREIFEEEFSKMVANAQPIPGFRRVKGGESFPLEVLGPSKVYKQVIKKVINKEWLNM
ncbi:hypothetical protein Ancab_039326 [Ancistrocladus abbreviatus]